MFIIGGIQKTSLLDFPKKIAAIVFTQGCNFRCGYCHNPELLEFSSKSTISEDSFFEFLNTRKGKLDGIVITGGEPTLQKGLYDFVLRVKALGFEVKLDTNGTNPKVLEKLIKENLLDYIAMDIKAPWEKYRIITNTDVNVENLKESAGLIMRSNADYEFRTTVVKSLIHIEDFEKIGEQIKGAKKYFLQKFVPSKIFDNSLSDAQTYTDEEFFQLCEKLKKYIEVVDFR